MSAIAPDASPVTPAGGAWTAGAPQSLRTRYFNVYRVASYFLVFYTLGHTLGAVIETPRFGPASDAVVSMMKSVHVAAQGADCTWYGFYRGMGASVSLSMIFQIVVTWYVGGKTSRERYGLAPVTWTLFLTMTAGEVLAWVYFFPAPVLFSTVTTVLVGIGCVQDWKAGPESTA